MQQLTYNIDRNRKGWVTITLHVLIWLMVFLIPYIFNADMERRAHHVNNEESEFLYLNTALRGSYPSFYLQKKSNYICAGACCPVLYCNFGQ
jgi:hypothetical protein